MGHSRSGRQWSRSADTRRAFLDAARAVFVRRGFAAAGVAEIVERAGASVGSLYHHFGGKSELFVAVWEEFQDGQERRAGEAVARARRAGRHDPVELFVAGARAYLEGAWEARDLVTVFSGDGPPGFEVMRRRRGREWIRQNRILLGAEDTPVDRLMVATLTTLIGEASRQIASCESAEETEEVVEAAVAAIGRLAPRHP